MLTDSDVGQLFAQMQAAYGHQWAHKSDAIPMWKRALGGFSANDVFNAVGKAVKVYPDFPPSLGQFAGMVEYSTPALPGPNNAHENIATADRIYSYAFPQDKIKNPKGNPHGIKLMENTAQRNVGESINQYETRIANEITLSLYPMLRAR